MAKSSTVTASATMFYRLLADACMAPETSTCTKHQRKLMALRTVDSRESEADVFEDRDFDCTMFSQFNKLLLIYLGRPAE